MSAGSFSRPRCLRCCDVGRGDQLSRAGASECAKDRGREGPRRLGHAHRSAEGAARPLHAGEDYAIPAENLRTYPVYLPDHEQRGYWDSLQKKKPDPLVDVSKIRTTSDWVEAGARAFRELDNPFSRTDDPALIAAIRDPKTFAGIAGLADGTVLDQRWVVTERGVMLTQWECAACHAKMAADRTVVCNRRATL